MTNRWFREKESRKQKRERQKQKFERLKTLSKEEILNSSFESLFLSVRAYNVLKNNKEWDEINTRHKPLLIRDVLQLTVRQIFFTKNVGKKTMREIEDVLGELGFKLQWE